ncbi:hypothetical protein ACAG25_18725 [Mycobacterium sp. pV006]|uniref:hypothetical protein n=1 Tax=Mycobacterium sp. pV006 TaxID=3238983 RepID=UPI00351B8BD5
MGRSRDAVSVAMVVPTPELLRQMLRQRPTCWPWAAFASALFQRWAALEERKIAQVCNVPAAPATRLRSDAEVAEFVTRQVRGTDDIVARTNAFLASPDFTALFGSAGDESTADADGILAAADYLGDCYESLLELAERARRHSVPEPHIALLADCTRFSNQHLQDFTGFMNDVLHRLEEMQNRAMLGQKPTPTETVRLRATTDDRLIWSILDRLHEIG